ncbi:MAG: hypothetical protein IPM82_03970 [Saprospiraceae bacterium]|nr:hypothetical protein [Saprospiraceae bacterium]
MNFLDTVSLGCDGIYESCGQLFTSIGQHQATCTSSQGCDSINYFTLVPGSVIADAGPDTMLNCIEATIMLDGTASSQGSNFQYV